ncbi:MAG: protein phosphatase 2C domain-containing protein [Pseudomonadota bacterium]
MSFLLNSSGLTDPGAHRRENQDALLLRPRQGVWVVADGMGGHDRGALASRRVVDSFARTTFAGSLKDRVQAAQVSIRAANDQIFSESRTQGANSIMGSTVAALVVSGYAYTALWAGDSRVYLFRRCRLRRLTCDHNLAQELVQAGKLTEDAARRHASASRITRAVGVRPEVAVDQVCGHLEEEDRLLLCSDGLINAVADIELATVLNDCGPEEAAAELMALALERGARDNVTVMVVAVGASCPLESTAGPGF